MWKKDDLGLELQPSLEFCLHFKTSEAINFWPTTMTTTTSMPKHLDLVVGEVETVRLELS